MRMIVADSHLPSVLVRWMLKMNGVWTKVLARLQEMDAGPQKRREIRTSLAVGEDERKNSVGNPR